jgi:DmsE family decaheme c-type cytochrome
MIMKKSFLGLFIAATLVAGAGAAKAADDPAASPQAAAYAEKAEVTCMKCHDDSGVLGILKTPHAMKGDSHTPFAQHACETCHGASPEHVKSRAAKGEPRPPVAIKFSGPDAAPVEKQNEVCFGCHSGDMRKAWMASPHQSNLVACVSCHTIHKNKDPVLVKATQPEKCFTCHAQQRAESFQFSHHPIREGKVVCSDCHNPHGSRGTKNLVEMTTNQVCYNCHAEKRGPYLFEHEPVREECTNCHVPHGSNEARLLKQRVPFLCISCHMNAGGPPSSSSGMVALGQTLTLKAFVNNGQNAAHGGGKGCENCHTQVHGSNSPNGSALIR